MYQCLLCPLRRGQRRREILGGEDMTNRSRFAIALAAVAGGITVANADVVLTLSYDDLSGSFDAGSSTFSAVAVDLGANSLQSAGEASRIDGNPGSASFGVGFVSGADQSNFTLNLTVVPSIPNLLAFGIGGFTATDVDGDTITGNLDGNWIYDSINGFIFFNGTITNVFLNDNGAQDDLFNGSQLGDFSMSGLGTEPFEGALTQITFGAASFFGMSFNTAATGVTAQILPAPGSLALLGLGGLMVARRRR